MRRTNPWALAVAVLLVTSSQLIAAGSQDVFKDAYARADVANAWAGKLKNQWTTTQASLVAAKKAADGGDFDTGTQFAKQAEDLANASIAQAEREKNLWKDSEIR